MINTLVLRLQLWLQLRSAITLGGRGQGRTINGRVTRMFVMALARVIRRNCFARKKFAIVGIAPISTGYLVLVRFLQVTRCLHRRRSWLCWHLC